MAWNSLKSEQLIATIDRRGSLRRPAVGAEAISNAQQQQPPELQQLNAALDDELSRRPLQLDPAGYFIIWVDW